MNKKQMSFIIRDLTTTVDRLVVERNATKDPEDSRILTEAISSIQGNTDMLRSLPLNG
jgi:hypothetical protein